MNTAADHSHLASVRHLLLRTGFAESVQTVIDASSHELPQLLQERIESTAAISTRPPPDWTSAPIPERPDLKSMTADEALMARQPINKLQREQTDELRQWWLSSLVETPNPLAARMTLFWQNHFTSQQRKVRHGHLMYRQQATLMRHAMGNFGELLTDMLQDPALLIYLDNRVNRRQKPNENLARELMELFTLGEGRYQETDIKELARALTGLSIDRDFNFLFKEKLHDDGEKTLLGTSGNLGLTDVVQIILQQEATAEHLVRKLWLHFISPTPDEQAVRELAAVYRESDYAMKPLLRALLGGSHFNDPAIHGQLIKSPVEFIAGTHRILGMKTVDGLSLMRASQSMQQILYEPPNVQGWVGGTHWINSHTLLARQRFTNKMLRDESVDMKELQLDVDADTVVACLLPIELDQGIARKGEPPIVQALRSPAYQLC